MSDVLLRRSWRSIYILLAVLLVLSNALLVAEQLNARGTVPAPIVVPASQDWDGSDGPWSSFTLQIGTPPQNVKTFVSTASTQTWAVAPEGCIPTDPSNCPDTRGRLYNYNQSSTWVPNLANASTQVYDLGLEGSLGYDDKGNVGRYGFDNITLGYKGDGGPSLTNQTLASIATTDFWLGIFGINPRPNNFTNFNDPIPSFLSNLRSQSLTPSTSWAYTAGNQYINNYVLGSLTIGGYDSSKFIPHTLTWDLSPADDRDLVVQIEDITTGPSKSLLPESIPAFLDSTVPFIWLPVAACMKFEEAFGLTLDNATGLYLLNDTQHANLKAQNPNITFTLGNLTSTTRVDIVFPYAAFDLTLMYPYITNATRYFPLKRAESADQYTLGRTFFQQAYVIADYDRRNFSVSQCKWDGKAQSIVAILPPANQASNGTSSGSGTGNTANSKNKKPFPIAAVAGGAGGGVILIISGILIFLFVRRKARKVAEEKDRLAAAANAAEIILKPELDGYERIPKIYETAPEVDDQGDAKNFVPSIRAVEIGDSGRNSPVYEMAAGEVAAEMPGSGKRTKSKGSTSKSIPRSPSSEVPPTERTRFLGQHPSSPLASPVSGTMSPGSPGSSLVSPTSMMHRERAEARSPRSAASAVSHSSLFFTDRSPVDELFYQR